MKSASSASLVDTNVLVYTHDPRDRRKQHQALALLGVLIDESRAALSVQCLTEFFRVVTQRLPDPVPSSHARTQVERWTRSCLVFDLTPVAVLEACRVAVERDVSIWDALIWAVAKLNQIRFVLTEDTEHGRFLEGVRYLNPFHPSFDLALLRQGP
jgi:predicted nucleic acid-binding protein